MQDMQVHSCSRAERCDSDNLLSVLLCASTDRSHGQTKVHHGRRHTVTEADSFSR